jgi:hypothetical protein
MGAPGPNITPEKFEELSTRYGIRDRDEFSAVIAHCITVWLNAWYGLYQDSPAMAWIVDERTGKTTRHFVHRGHALQALLEIERELREVVLLLRNPHTGAYQAFFETAHRSAGPDEPPPALGRPGAGSRILASIREAIEVAREARDSSALEHLPEAPRRRPGRPELFGAPGRLIVRRLARFSETSMELPVAVTKQVDGTLRLNEGALFVQDAAAAVMAVRGNGRPSPRLIREILGTRSAADT